MNHKKFKAFASDFVHTISDSEENIPDFELSSDEVVHNPRSKSIKRNDKNQKELQKEKIDEDINKDLNPDFCFSVDDNDTSLRFTGWDFLGDQKNDEITKKDVNLDEIIQRKNRELNVTEMENSEDDSQPDISDEVLETEKFDTEDLNRSNSLDNCIKNMESSNDDQDSPEALSNFFAFEEGEEAKKIIHDSFNKFSLSRPILKGLNSLGYIKPSPIQSATIPISLLGKDIVAGAVTGSGKTAAFMIPIIERLIYKPSRIASIRVIILAPTRELAIQISDVGRKIGKFVNNLSFGLAVGGLNLRQQEQSLKLRPDIVIATPGRLIDHIRNSASFSTDSVEVLVIDEADRMLEEGFQDELREIMSLIPSKRQTLLFSATMNSSINQLIGLSLKKPVRIMIDPPKQTATNLTQEFVRIRKRDHLKPSLLYYLIKKLGGSGQKRIVAFVSRKEVVHKLRIILGILGMKVGELHGSLTQDQRLQSVNKFKTLEINVLICTDLASRGLDIPKIELVINYDMPKTHEIYLHRVGRTARAGREGRSISFVGESTQDRNVVKDAIKSIENLENSGKVLSRSVDWNQIENINKVVESKESIIQDILEEEKQEKEILRAEMEIQKGENILKYRDEIQSKPKRTWFQSANENKNSKILQAFSKNKKTVNSKKRKQNEAKEIVSRSYKKTRVNRIDDQERSFKNQKIKKKTKY